MTTLILLLLSLNSFAKTTPVDLDFIKHEWKHILFFECNTRKDYDCIKACTILKTNDEINCLGLTIKANPDFYFDLINENLNTPANWTGKVCTEPTLLKIKRRYFKKYYKPFENIEPCLKSVVFDAGVLSGPAYAKKLLKRAKKSKLRGNRLRDHYQHLYRETRLKTIRFQSGKKKGKLKWEEYGRGWQRRLDHARKIRSCD